MSPGPVSLLEVLLLGSGWLGAGWVAGLPFVPHKGML